MKESRLEPRKLLRGPVRFRIVREGQGSQISEPIEAKIRDLSTRGMALETSCIEADGLHISFNDHPGNKNHVYLKWELPTGRSLKAVGETVWYERLSAVDSLFVVGLKFSNISEEDKNCLRDFLEASTTSRVLSV